MSTEGRHLVGLKHLGAGSSGQDLYAPLEFILSPASSLSAGSVSLTSLERSVS